MDDLEQPKHEIKYCPKCNNLFECKVGSITLCQCRTVSLNEQELAFINEYYEDCLCSNCLKELKQEYFKQKYEWIIQKLTGKIYERK